MLVMLQAFLESLGPYVFYLMMVVTCFKIACRMFWVMVVGIRVSGRLVDHLACLLAWRRRPYAAVLKVGRVTVKDYGKVLSWEGKHLGSIGDRLVVDIRLHRVCRAFLNL